jgi:RHS repeat-associated protein
MNQPETTPETDLYFSHPDHLGSASWITDTSGDAIQHLQYLPFGETVLDQRTTEWNTRYSFSAKEKDEESGYSYFGARYYDSELSIWLSVDPMAAKYPGLTPYNYCAGNPMILVDPNGMEIGNYIDEAGNYLGTDGINDGKVYVVTDKVDKDKIQNNNGAGGTTQTSEVGSAMQLPDAGLRSSMLDQVTAADQANPYAEHGGLYGTQWNSETQSNDLATSIAPSGPNGDPCLSGATVTGPDYNAAWNSRSGFTPEGTYHSHPSGTCASTGNGFDQKVSDADRSNLINNNAVKFPMMQTHPSIVFGMRDNNVRLYNTKGKTATMPFNVFRNAR